MKKLLTLVLLFISISTFAQDKIIKKNGDTITCKVTEMGADEVKYFYSDNPKLIFGIDKAKLEKIEFGTGEVIVVKSDTFKDEEYYANQHKHAIKIAFLSPLFGHTELSYEQYIKPGRSWEVGLGIIGLGMDTYDINAKGVYTKFAYKMIRKPDYYSQRMHYSHILKGAYIAPEIALRYVSYYAEVYNDYTYRYEGEQTVEEFAFALTLKFGKQWVIEDGFIIDFYLGLGYGTSNDEQAMGLVPFGFVTGVDVPIAFTSGLRIGWAL
jgi:hypothetical protein